MHINARSQHRTFVHIYTQKSELYNKKLITRERTYEEVSFEILLG